MVTLGGPIDVDAVDGMKQLIAWSNGHVKWYRAQVQALVPDALVWGQSEVRESDTQGLTVKEVAQVNAWLRLYNEERERLAKFCATAMQHGLAEREIRAMEQYGDQIAGAMTEYARRLAEQVALSPDQLAAAVRLVPEVLRELDAATSRGQ